MPATATKPARADRFREMAGKLADEILYKRTSGVASQRMTPRRAAMAESARAEADRLNRVRLALVGMADAIDAGALPESLAAVSTKSAVEAILAAAAVCERARTRPSQQARDLLALLPAADPADARQAEIAAMERKLVGSKIPDFFPTPPALADRVVELAEIPVGTVVLEPSAGKGDIVEAIGRAAIPGVIVHCIEINHLLRDILTAKGCKLIGDDFLEHDDAPVYDRVVMNPPFGRGADIDHVRHAYDLLAPGGRLVSVMSTGPFANAVRKAVDFRDWFASVGGERHDVEAGAFAAGDRATGIATGVSSCVVVIDKPS